MVVSFNFCTFGILENAFMANQIHLIAGADDLRIAFSRSEKPRGRSLRERAVNALEFVPK